MLVQQRLDVAYTCFVIGLRHLVEGVQQQHHALLLQVVGEVGARSPKDSAA